MPKLEKVNQTAKNEIWENEDIKSLIESLPRADQLPYYPNYDIVAPVMTVLENLRKANNPIQVLRDGLVLPRRFYKKSVYGEKETKLEDLSLVLINNFEDLKIYIGHFTKGVEIMNQVSARKGKIPNPAFRDYLIGHWPSHKDLQEERQRDSEHHRFMYRLQPESQEIDSLEEINTHLSQIQGENYKGSIEWLNKGLIQLLISELQKVKKLKSEFDQDCIDEGAREINAQFTIFQKSLQSLATELEDLAYLKPYIEDLISKNKSGKNSANDQYAKLKSLFDSFYFNDPVSKSTQKERDPSVETLSRLFSQGILDFSGFRGDAEYVLNFTKLEARVNKEIESIKKNGERRRNYRMTGHNPDEVAQDRETSFKQKTQENQEKGVEGLFQEEKDKSISLINTKIEFINKTIKKLKELYNSIINDNDNNCYSTDELLDLINNSKRRDKITGIRNALRLPFSKKS
jgi:hypothetical protein